MRSLPSIPLRFLLTLFLLIRVTISVDTVLSRRFNHPGFPQTATCPKIAPGVCCATPIPIDSNYPVWGTRWGASNASFHNLLDNDIAAIWNQSFLSPETNVPDPRYCGTSVLDSRPGPGHVEFSTEPRQPAAYATDRHPLGPLWAEQISGASYISLHAVSLPPDSAGAQLLMMEGILGLVWGGGQWFASQKTQAVVARIGGLSLRRMKARRGIISPNKGQVYAQSPTQWVYPSIVEVDGVRYENGGEGLVYKDATGKILDLATMKPSGKR